MTPLEIKKWLDRIDRDQLSTGEYAAVTEAAEIMELVQEVIRLRTAQHKQQSVEEENELANDMAEALDALKAWKP